MLLFIFVLVSFVPWNSDLGRSVNKAELTKTRHVWRYETLYFSLLFPDIVSIWGVMDFCAIKQRCFEPSINPCWPGNSRCITRRVAFHLSRVVFCFEYIVFSWMLRLIRNWGRTILKTTIRFVVNITLSVTLLNSKQFSDGYWLLRVQV